MNKRLIILLAILIILIIGVGVWWWFTRPVSTEPGITLTDPGQAFPVPPPLPASTSTPPIEALNPPAAITPAQPAEKINPRIIVLSGRAVAGAAVIPPATSTEADRVIFLERETGLIIEMNLTGREPREIARLPVRLPDGKAGRPIEDVILTPNSSKLSLWFSTITGAGKNYFTASLNLATTTEGFNLPEIAPEPMNPGTQAVALAPNLNRLFTLELIGEETIGQVLDLKTKKSRLVFNSKVNQWLIAWPEKNLIALTNKPASQTTGYLYLLNLRNNELQKMIGGVNGLATLVSPDGQKILYSRSGPRHLELNLYDRLRDENRTLAITTLSEKCVWRADSTVIYCAAPRSLSLAVYPDDWLAGGTAGDDLLWQIDAATGASRLIWADEPGLGDAVNLLIADQGKKFVFTDRLTNRLYLIDELISPPLSE